MFSEILKKLRKCQNISQGELASALKLSRSTVAMYEAGERMPKYETMKAIADVFSVDINYLYERSSDHLLANSLKMGTNEMNEMQSIGSQIRALRTKSGMTQKELAQKLGKTESAVRMWELDKSEPRISELRKLAAIFDTSVDWMLGISNDVDNKKTPLTDQERELHFLMTYDRMEIAALESASQIIKWDNGGRTETFPFAKEEAEQIVTDLLEVLFWRCGGIRELFFSNPEYRQERMRRGNSPDMMTLDLADKIAELIKEVC